MNPLLRMNDIAAIAAIREWVDRRGPARADVRVCVECGAPYLSTNQRRLYCSRTCGNRRRVRLFHRRVRQGQRRDAA